MAKKSAWLPVLPDPSKAQKTEEIRGVRYNVYVSPHDVPVAARGFFDKDLRRFVIEFRYVDEEPWQRERMDKTLSARVGKRSGRLYGLEVDSESLKVDAVGVELHVLEHILNEAARTAPRPQNYEAVEQLLRTHWGELVPAANNARNGSTACEFAGG